MNDIDSSGSTLFDRYPSEDLNIRDSDFIPYDSPEYERDAAGNIKIYNPEPEPTFWYSYNGYPSEPLLNELIEIKGLLKQILDKL